jgi:hypothetical protein
LAEHAELETQATLGRRLGYIDENDMAAFEAPSASTGQLTHGLLRSLDKVHNESRIANPESRIPNPDPI